MAGAIGILASRCLRHVDRLARTVGRANRSPQVEWVVRARFDEAREIGRHRRVAGAIGHERALGSAVSALGARRERAAVEREPAVRARLEAAVGDDVLRGWGRRLELNEVDIGAAAVEAHE